MAVLGQSPIKQALEILANEVAGEYYGPISKEIREKVSAAIGKTRKTAIIRSKNSITLFIKGVDDVGKGNIFNRMPSVKTHKEGNFVTITIPNDKIKISNLKSNSGEYNLGHYIEALFQQSLLEQLGQRIGKNQLPNSGSYSAISELVNKRSSKFSNLYEVLKSRADTAAQMYLDTQMGEAENIREMESLFDRLMEDIQGGFASNTPVGDIIAKEDKDFPARIIEVKGYDDSREQSIKWMETSSEALFGPESSYLQYLTSIGKAYAGFNDETFMNNYRKFVPWYIYSKLSEKKSGNAKEHLEYLLQKQSINRQTQENELARQLANKVVVVISPDGKHITVTAPLNQILEIAENTGVAFGDLSKIYSLVSAEDAKTQYLKVIAEKESFDAMEKHANSHLDPSLKTSSEIAERLNEINIGHVLKLRIQIFPALLRLQQSHQDF